MNLAQFTKVIFVISMLAAVCESSLAGRKVEPLFPTLKNITCYECLSEYDGPMCYNDSQLTTEARVCTQSIVKGGGCAVYRFDTSELDTGIRTHSIERKCVDTCKPDCVVVGERHKLYLCTSCCNTTLCNIGDGATSSTTSLPLVILCLAGLSLSTRTRTAFSNLEN